MPDPRFRNAAGTVVFLGRFDEPRKGLDVLLRAFAEIAGARPGVRLLVAGRGEAGPLRGLIPRQHRQAVRFLGVLDDHTKARLLASADVFVAPNSGGESCGLVLLEAMAAGVPVVASDIEAFDLVCEGGRLGALFPNGSPGGLADAVLSGLGGDCARARAKAAQVAVRRYDWATVTRQILDVYERVVAEPHARAGA